MLSTEYTLPEMKKHLIGYADYGFADQPAMDTALTNALNEFKYEFLYDYIKSLYEDGTIQTISTAATDWDDFLTDLEDEGYRHIFYAEVYYGIARFLRELDDDEVQGGSVSGGSFSIEGYSQTDPSDDTMNVYAKQSQKFYNKGKYHMMKAGHDVGLSISRIKDRV